VLQLGNAESMEHQPLDDLYLKDLGELRALSGTFVEAYPALQRPTVGGMALTCSLTRARPGGQIEW
jgi:hypothetical protein